MKIKLNITREAYLKLMRNDSQAKDKIIKEFEKNFLITLAKESAIIIPQK